MAFEDIFSISLAILLIGCSSIYFFFAHKFAYWQRRDIKSLPPSIPLGNFGPKFTMRIQLSKIAGELYHQTTEPFIGIYACVRPVLLLRDPDLIRQILITDFQYFSDRAFHTDKENDPISSQLTSLSGDKWRKLRSKLTPAFTSGKLKAMFTTIINCGIPLQRLLNDVASKGGTVDMREVAARYATDVIASVAFGIEINCVDDPSTSFRAFGRKFYEMNAKNGIRFLGQFLCPSLMKRFKIRLVPRDIEHFIVELVKDMLDYREKNNVVRKDILQLLIQLRNTGTVQLDGEWETEIVADESRKMLTLNDIAANSFVFFASGFETTSTTSSFCLFELARNADIQRKVHAEIDEVLAKHNGRITYEAMAEMTFLDKCVDETLRKYPAVPMLERVCTKTPEYKIPGTDVVLEKGTFVLIPLMGLQRDAKYFPNPLKFIPERFDDKTRIRSMTYWPFGDGPRNCIGIRLGRLQTKIAIVLMMQNCRYELADAQYYDQELPIIGSTLTITPTCGIQLKVYPRSH